MKIDIWIVDLAVIASVVIPYILLIIAGFNETKTRQKKFLQEAGKNQMVPSETDHWNLNTIGIDRNLQKLLFVQQSPKGDRIEYYDLKNIRKSTIVSTTKSIRINDKVEEVLQRIDLEFEGSFSGEKQLLNLYDCDLTYSQDYELAHAQKWNEIINAALSYKPTMNSAA
ncbi:hypothetical protein GCM10007103_13420 [Salinimicrobium marinum]|uniref:Uncharacterized protein n=1 Tax=Salinimicrobium marinum TaxID=680283 RepID=A0A918SAQ6_9FLAO|nr:hypothetical protein [Salinimicrobium marinum]GHA33229.1 hypothetical protein GCM10007103_13420 [Salinimicrobium marinum]